MRKFLIVGALAFTGFAGAASAQQADNSWILDLQNQACSDESRQTIADTIRQQIEDSVARATAAIQPPAAIGDLSCLNDLMNAPLDSFSNMGGILGSLQGGLGGAIGSVGDLDISRRVCEFAAERWSNVTEPLDFRLSEISGSGTNIWENFNLSGNGSAPTNRPSQSGNWQPDVDEDEQPTGGTGNTGNTGTTGTTGGGTTTTPPRTSVFDNMLPGGDAWSGGDR